MGRVSLAALAASAGFGTALAGLYGESNLNHTCTFGKPSTRVRTEDDVHSSATQLTSESPTK